MNALKLTQDRNEKTDTEREAFVDMSTIRRRLSRIKNNWSAETTRARAFEGARRREELARLCVAVDERIENAACDELTPKNNDSGKLARAFGLVG